MEMISEKILIELAEIDGLEKLNDEDINNIVEIIKEQEKSKCD